MLYNAPPDLTMLRQYLYALTEPLNYPSSIYQVTPREIPYVMPSLLLKSSLTMKYSVIP